MQAGVWGFRLGQDPETGGAEAGAAQWLWEVGQADPPAKVGKPQPMTVL